MSHGEPYPSWKFYPSRNPAPNWVAGVLEAFEGAADDIDSHFCTGVNSDAVLAAVRPALIAVGFDVEASKAKADKITRPVLFGENGSVLVQYDVDAYHPDHHVVLEVEAGRGAASNADYRDLVRASLMVDVSYLVLAMMLTYKGGGQTVRSYEVARSRIDAIFASERLALPLDGVLLVGY
ncbi:MAG: hypothetical protein ACR2ML_07205 [Solirubrobacteraceae bacterium]